MLADLVPIAYFFDGQNLKIEKRKSSKLPFLAITENLIIKIDFLKVHWDRISKSHEILPAQGHKFDQYCSTVTCKKVFGLVEYFFQYL